MTTVLASLRNLFHSHDSSHNVLQVKCPPLHTNRQHIAGGTSMPTTVAVFMPHPNVAADGLASFGLKWPFLHSLILFLVFNLHTHTHLFLKFKLRLSIDACSKPKPLSGCGYCSMAC